MLTGILEVTALPVQTTFWRLLASLHLVVALLEVGRQMRQRVWEAAHIGLKEVTLDTDTTVQTVYGRQMGARKGYNPKHRGKKSYQPILKFLAETREYVGGELRKGDRPTGKPIAAHLESVFAALPKSVERVYARADSGFYCREAVEAYEKFECRFVLSAQKTARLVEELTAARWTGSPRTDADGQCEFRYQPEGWSKATGSWRCARRRSRSQRSWANPSNTSYSTRRSTATEYWLPISTCRSTSWSGFTDNGRGQRI